VSPLRAALKYTPNLENHLSLIRKASTVKEVPSSLQVDAAEIASGESRVEGCRGGCPAPLCE
jgi:hypothetical protein